MKTHRTVKCPEPGCPEHARFQYDSQRDARSDEARRSRDRWKCTRHTNPETLLGLTNLERITISEAKPSPRLDDKTSLFWTVGEHVGSGFVHGPGFKAMASDFPAGTKLIVTARIELALPENAA